MAVISDDCDFSKSGKALLIHLYIMEVWAEDPRRFVPSVESVLGQVLSPHTSRIARRARSSIRAESTIAYCRRTRSPPI
jgi:hypothetical protein